MRKEFEFKFKEEKFIIKKKDSDEECFSIDINNLQFDIRKFYEGVFVDVNEHIEIEIVNECNFSENDAQNIVKKADYVYNSLIDITQNICSRLNEVCFTLDS
jgi:molybdopterin/thiamine biosynthesis adenylyltransferase